MMNYEELYEALSASEKELNDTVKAAANQTKALIKNTEAGNITELHKTANIFLDTAARLQELGWTLSDTADAFDTKEYFAGGDFSRQMVEACLSLGIDVQGENGVYEMFPFKVRVIGDEEHDGEVYLNRKKLPTCPFAGI